MCHNAAVSLLPCVQGKINQRFPLRSPDTGLPKVSSTAGVPRGRIHTAVAGLFDDQAALPWHPEIGRNNGAVSPSVAIVNAIKVLAAYVSLPKPAGRG